MPQVEPNLKLEVSYKQILGIALPICIAIFIPNINFLTNNYFIGNYDKSGDLLAVGGITGVYYLVFAVTGYALNNGLQALISRRAGEDRIDEISKLFWNGIRMALVVSVFAIFLSYTVGSYLLENTLKSERLISLAVDFLRLRIWGLPLMLIFQMCNALLISTNNTRFLLYGALAETLVNIVFDYAFIFGKWGFPEMGFNGAAYASILMEAVGLAVVMGVIYGKGVAQKLQLHRHRAFNKSIFSLIAIQSLPLVFQQVMSIMSWEYFFILVERHSQIVRGDTLESAISNVMRNFFGFFGCTTWALASTCNSLVSNVIGQGQNDKVMKVVRMIIVLSGALGVFFALLMNIFPTALLSIFGQDAIFLQEAIPVVRLVSLAVVFMAVAAVTLNGVNGTGQTRVTLAIEIVAILFYCLYIYLIFERWQLPFIWGWLCEILYWSIIFTAAFFYLKSGKWRGKKI
jgi:multidrug resistance protein, MATE family